MKTRGLNIPCIQTVEDVLSHSYGVHSTKTVITAPVLSKTTNIGKTVSVEPVHLEKDVSVEPAILVDLVDKESEPVKPTESEPVKPTESESSKPKRVRRK